MAKTFFITGIGTDVGKTLVAAILAEALQADYWKPIQAGLEGETDAQIIASLVSNKVTTVHEELYRLQTPASPHIAARMDTVTIDLAKIKKHAAGIQEQTNGRDLLIEGAGGLLVPLSDDYFVADMIRSLGARVILVSRNYLGSINHSLLTAAYCKQAALEVAGWIFTDDYLSYETEIVRWSGYPSLGSIPGLTGINRKSISEQAARIRAGWPL